MNKNEIKQKVEDNKKIIFTGVMLSLLLIFAYVGFTQEIGSVTVVPAEEQTPVPGENTTIIQENQFDSTVFNMAYVEFVNCENPQDIEIDCQANWLDILPDTPELDFMEENTTEPENSTA